MSLSTTRWIPSLNSRKSTTTCPLQGHPMAALSWSSSWWNNLMQRVSPDPSWYQTTCMLSLGYKLISFVMCLNILSLSEHMIQILHSVFCLEIFYFFCFTSSGLQNETWDCAVPGFPWRLTVETRAPGIGVRVHRCGGEHPTKNSHQTRTVSTIYGLLFPIFTGPFLTCMIHIFVAERSLVHPSTHLSC